MQHEKIVWSQVWAATFCHLPGLSGDLKNPSDYCNCLLSPHNSAWSSKWA